MGLVELVEPPVVGTLIDMAVNESLDWYRKKRLSSKLKTYQGGADVKKDVKHSIKSPERL